MKSCRMALFLVIWISLAIHLAFGFDSSHVERLRSTKKCPRCDLQVATFENMNLNLADMQGAYCTAVNFDDASLQAAIFEGAILIAASLRKAYLEEANFKQAKLQDADLSGSHLVNAIFKQANLRGANLKDAVLIGANFEGATWTDGRICQRGSVGKCVK